MPVLSEATSPRSFGVPKYGTLFERLVANTAEPANDQACWLWVGKCSKRYPTLNVRIGGKHRTIKAHRAMLVCCELDGEPDLFWDLYELYSVAEFEGDHLCFNNPLCINPDHLQWLTEQENSAKRWVPHADQRRNQNDLS